MSKADANVKLGITADAEQAKTTLKGFSGSLKGVTGGLDSSLKSLTGFSLGAFSAAGAVAAIGKTIKDSISEFADYTDQISKMSSFTGMATEETSKLYQITDDLRIPVNSLEMALKTMADQGTVPTIKGMQDLSDEYRSIQDPLKKANFLIDNFGRSGQEMARMMDLGSEAIGEMSDEVSDWMLVTEESEQAVNDYLLAMDSWEESIQSVKFELAQNLLPVMNKTIDNLLIWTSIQDDLDDSIEKHFNDIRTTSTSYEEYIAEINRVLYIKGLQIDTEGELIAINRAGGMSLKEYSGELQILTENQFDSIDSIIQLSASYATYSAAMQTATVDTESLQQALKDTNGVFESVKGGMEKFSASMIFNLVAPTLSSVEAQERLRDSLGLTDDATIVSKELIAEMAAQYLDEAPLKYASMVGEVYDAIERLKDKKVTVTVTTVREEIIRERRIIEGFSDETAADMKRGYASGGSFRIPPGYPNDSFYLGAGNWGQSGETVTVSPAGKDAGSVTIENINVYPNSGVSAIQYSIERAKAAAL